MSISIALSVEPLGPINRCRLFTNRSLFRTIPPILITSQFVSSSSTFNACGAGTDRLSSFIKSLAFMMMYGSKVFRVVRTVIEPSTRFNSQLTPCSFSAFVTLGHVSRKYFSRYFGNSTANELSSSTPFGLSSAVNGVTLQ